MDFYVDLPNVGYNEVQETELLPYGAVK